MQQVSKKKIFISYRVKDTQAATGRLVDALKLHFDEDQIFLDIDRIEPGLDFTEVISKYLDSSDIMLVIIGPDWMAYNSERNTYRINEKNDWVRLEIATALQRNIRVVPVLLEGASLPDEELLTEDLKPLLRRQSYEISNKRWKYDSEQLIEFLKKVLGQAPVPKPTPAPAAPAVPKKSKTVYWLIGAAIVLLGIIGNAISENDNKRTDPIPGGNESQVQNNNAVQPANTRVTENSAPEQTADISGKWFDPNGKGTYVFGQNGQQLNLSVFAVNGEQTGQGSGSISGQSVNLQLSFVLNGMQIPCSLTLEMAPNGVEMNGHIHVSENGSSYSEALHMERM